jgi:hypothetical protein
MKTNAHSLGILITLGLNSKFGCQRPVQYQQISIPMIIGINEYLVEKDSSSKLICSQIESTFKNQ